MTASLRELERRIERVKKRLCALGDLRPGSLSEQYNVCGNPRCRCKEDPPQKHGPYQQLSYVRAGKSTTRFIRKPDVPTVRRQLKNYELLRTLIDEWIDTSLAICELKLKASRANPRPATRT